MNKEQIDELYTVYRRLPVDKREGEIMYEALNSDGKRTICDVIEEGISNLKNCRYKAEKVKQYFLIATGFKQYFKQTATATFKRRTIATFFIEGDFAKSTEQRHIKNIVDTLKQNGTIADDKIEKEYKQQRVYSLKSNDFDGSYFALMKGNGFNSVGHFVWYCDKEGIPRRRKVATSNINGTPRDKNGDIYDGKIDLSVLKQTIPREKQGVFSYGNKSIATEKRTNKVKCLRVIS